MKKLIVITFSFILLLSVPIFSQSVSKVGTTAAGFLNIDVGARAVSMGGAFVSVADDISAMYWNSAGIARFSRSKAMFSHTNWIGGVTFNYAGVAVPMGHLGTVGINATFLTMPDMERTTILEPDGTGEMFSAGSYAFGLCFARALTDRFSIGLNAKYVTEEIYHSRSQGLALDVGTLFNTQFYGLTIGMNISNFGTKLNLSGRDMLTQSDIDPQIYGNNPNINASLNTDDFDMPLMFRVGVSTDVLNGKGNSNLILAADALHPSDDVESVNLGGEYVFNKTFSLRAGYRSVFADSEEGLSFGAGLKYQLMEQAEIVFDYAYLDFGILDNIQKFTLTLTF